jgi:DNA-binding NarL/FixJ family response regulator
VTRAGYRARMTRLKPAAPVSREGEQPSSVRRPRPGPVRVTVADECELVSKGLAALLAPYDDLTLVPSAPGGGLATFVDVTLHDTFARVPLEEDTLDRLANRPSGGRLVVYTWNLQQGLVDVALAHGAAGCLSKCLPAEELAECLLRIATGETVVRGVTNGTSSEAERAALTPREAEVVGLIAAGLSNHEIANATGLSINSVKSYIRGAYRKIHVTTRSQAVLWALRHGCVHEPTASMVPPPPLEATHIAPGRHRSRVEVRGGVRIRDRVRQGA